MTKQAPAEAPRWPAVEYEERPWAIDDRGPISRTQRRRVTGPYEAAVPAEIAAIASVPTSKETATLAEEATAEGGEDGGPGAEGEEGVAARQAEQVVDVGEEAAADAPEGEAQVIGGGEVLIVAQ